MRISTLNLYQQGISSIESAQSLVAQTQEQISTGKMVNVPSDNPLAATQILATTDAQSTNTQYAANQSAAKTTLTQTDSTLSQITNLLQSVRTTIVSANNGSLTAGDRGTIASTLQGQLQQLVALSNTQDGEGNYLFAGYEASSPPFTQNASGVAYTSDDGVRTVQVSGSRQIPTNVTGDQVFDRIRSGNGVFTTGGSLTNTGSGAVDTGQVTSPALLTGHNYAIQFSVTGSQTTYSVTDTTTGQPVNAPAASNDYTSGSAIGFDGIQFSISGAPANGDTFSVAPSQNQSVFTTIQQTVTMLQASATTASGIGALGGLTTSLQNIDQAMNQVSSVQSSVGARENELTTLASINTAANLQNTSTLSSLQDTDIAKAATALAEQSTVLSAAEASFTKVTATNLFDYLK